MLGPDTSALTATATLIALSWIVLVVLILPLSPIVRDKGLDEDEYSIFDEPLPFVYNYLIPLMGFLMNELSLFATAMVEPGIVPPRKSSVKTLVLSHELRMHNKHLYCSICNIVRPDMRCRHCKHCNCCVQVLDHHCPWIGTCIGVRNYRFFFMFVVSVVLSILFLIGNVAWVVNEWMTGNLSTERDVSLSAHQRAAYSFLIAASAILYLGFLLFSASLLVFHCYLIRNCSTTAEFLRRNYDQHHSSTVTVTGSPSASASVAASSNAGTTTAASAPEALNSPHVAATSASTGNESAAITGSMAGASEGGTTNPGADAAATAVATVAMDTTHALDVLEQGLQGEGGEKSGKEEEQDEDEDEDGHDFYRDRSGSISSVRSALSAASRGSRSYRGDYPIDNLHARSATGAGKPARGTGVNSGKSPLEGSGGEYMPLAQSAGGDGDGDDGLDEARGGEGGAHGGTRVASSRVAVPPAGGAAVPLVPSPHPSTPSSTSPTGVAGHFRRLMDTLREMGAVLGLYLCPPVSLVPPMHVPPSHHDQHVEQRRTEETTKLLQGLLREYRAQGGWGHENSPFVSTGMSPAKDKDKDKDKDSNKDSRSERSGASPSASKRSPHSLTPVGLSSATLSPDASLSLQRKPKKESGGGRRASGGLEVLI